MVGPGVHFTRVPLGNKKFSNSCVSCAMAPSSKKLTSYTNSVEFEGYCDFSVLVGLEVPICWRTCLVEENCGVNGARELLPTDPRRGRGRTSLFRVPLLRIDGLEAVRVDVKDDSEVCRFKGAFVLPVLLVEGRYERTEVILG